MPALNRRRVWSKKPKSNPYAQRGLDQFALVSAQLQAARDTLVAQLGTQLSLVRFTSSSDESTWIPIIVAPTSSKAEMRAFRRVASDLVTGRKHLEHDSNIPVAGSLLKHLGSSIGEYNTHEGFGISENNTAHDGNTHLRSTIREISFESSIADTAKNDVDPNAISKHDNQTGILGYLMEAIQGFLWMVNITAFGLRIIADFAVSKAISSTERHTDGDKHVIIDHPSCAEMASSSDTSSQVQPIMSVARTDIKGMMPPPALHVEAPKMNRFLSTPSSPRSELTKPLSASVSFPKTAYLHGRTAHGGNKENNQAQKTNPNQAVKSSICMVDATASKMSPEKLGQALSGAGLVLVLGGLVMGYTPAIVCVVCWWYVLPSMRNAVGDKPLVRSHHHHHHHHHHGSQEEIKSNTVVSSVKNDNMQYQEYIKKKVIMDGLLERRQRHHPTV